MASTWIETVLAFVLGAVLFALEAKDLANITWILGLFLSVGRLNFSRSLEEELGPVVKLSEIVDLDRKCSVAAIQRLLNLYLQISEPEFRKVKDGVVSEANERLLRLVHEKTSDELPTGEYYAWLLPILEETKAGTQVWAVSMMLDSEWDDSPAERRFLEGNLNAARRGAFVERIFVLPKAILKEALIQNDGVRSHLENASDHMRAFMVEREFLEVRDSDLLSQLGDGLIAFDDRVALVDAAADGQIRGRLTMNPSEIARLRKIYENLKLNARELTEVATQQLPG